MHQKPREIQPGRGSGPLLSPLVASWRRIRWWLILIVTGSCSWTMSCIVYSLTPHQARVVAFYRSQPVLHLEAVESYGTVDGEVNFAIFASNIGNVPAELTFAVRPALDRVSIDKKVAIKVKPAIPFTASTTANRVDIHLDRPLDPGVDAMIELTRADSRLGPDHRYTGDEAAFELRVMTQQGPVDLGLSGYRVKALNRPKDQPIRRGSIPGPGVKDAPGPASTASIAGWRRGQPGPLDSRPGGPRPLPSPGRTMPRMPMP